MRDQDLLLCKWCRVLFLSGAVSVGVHQWGSLW
jgi:hypothetical protein